MTTENIFKLVGSSSGSTAPLDSLYTFLDPPSYGSAFIPYLALGRDPTQVFQYCKENSTRSSSRNVPKRAIELLRCIPLATNVDKAISNTKSHVGGSRSFRHMMRERYRRERQSQCYQDLHSMIGGSKADKNSIIQSSMVSLRELKATEAELLRQHQELKLRIKKIEEDGGRSEIEKKIQVKVVNPPPSSIDSFASAFLRLKGFVDVDVKSFRSKCSSDEFVATFEVETKMETEILEKSVQRVMNNAHLGYNPMCKKY